MKFMWGLLVGFGLGVAVGLLLAPQTGEATRAQITEQGITLRNCSSSLSDELRARASQIGEDLRARANDALIQGREMYVHTKDDLTERYSRSKSGEL